MGSIPEIFPTSVLLGFNKYKKIFSQESAPPCEYTLQFSALFQIPWILSFTYKKQEAEGTSPPLLYRQFSVKWWKKINEEQADVKAVTLYYENISRSSPSPYSPSSSSSTTDTETIRRI